MIAIFWCLIFWKSWDHCVSKGDVLICLMWSKEVRRLSVKCQRETLACQVVSLRGEVEAELRVPDSIIGGTTWDRQFFVVIVTWWWILKVGHTWSVTSFNLTLKNLGRLIWLVTSRLWGIGSEEPGIISTWMLPLDHGFHFSLRKLLTFRRQKQAGSCNSASFTNFILQVPVDMQVVVSPCNMGQHHWH